MRKYLSNWKGLIYNSAFFLNGLLLFLLLFESRFTVPFWMQAVGRLHPLVLHFPLVVLILYSSWILIIEKPNSARWHAQLADSLLLLGTLTAVGAAFSGFILSKEGGYESDTLLWHKWLGVAISLISLALYGSRKYLPPWKALTKLITGSFLLLVFAGGHLGGNLTHGEGFLISPLKPSGEVPKVAIEEALVYDNLVKPVLEQKCLSCHNEEKAKGGLQMQTPELFTKGGKNGVPWDTAKADLGMLISRLHLPQEDKNHMPPMGKVQLTDEEMVLLSTWVKGGSRFDQLVSSLPAKSPVYAYAQNVLGGNRIEERYDFSAADANEIKKLNTTYRLIKPLSAESPALFVNFYNRANFKSEDIRGLMPLNKQIVSIDLSKMPVKDEDLKTLAEFPELRKLILNFTDITGATLGELRKLGNLSELSLSGTAVKMEDIKALEAIPSLKQVYLWSTGLSNEELALLKKGRKIVFETGFRSDTIKLALNPPGILNESRVLFKGETISLKHQIAGTVIRYTLDGSAPDSIHSPIYDKPISITRNTTLKARAFRDGWYGSRQITSPFFKAGYPIDSVGLYTPAEGRYKAKGAISLFDGKAGDPDQDSGYLGYNKNDFQSCLYFKNPVMAGQVTLSMLQNLGNHIFPPVQIEVWGGANEESLKLLNQLTPQVPDQSIPNAENLIYETTFEPLPVNCLKILVKPLTKLPDWHVNKGGRAWVFIDEILVN